jgi:ABC-2 type transport system permease protein
MRTDAVTDLARLARVEITRLRWRRAVLVLVPIAVLTPLAMLLVWTLTTQPPSAADRERAEAQVAAEIESPRVQRRMDHCLRRTEERRDELTAAQVQQRCERRVYPDVEWYLPYNTMQPREAVVGYAPAVALLVAVVLGLSAMTYAGADWASGSMSNQLLFNPRRPQLFAAKLVAIGVWAVVVTVVVFALWWGCFALVAATRDLDWRAAWTSEAWWLAVRSVVLSAIVATGCFALTMLVRHTVAALGVALGVVGISLMFIHGLELDSLAPLSFVWNTGGILADGVRYVTVDWDAEAGRDRLVRHVVGPYQGFAFYGALWAVVTAGAAAAFRRRDVP